MKSRTAPAALSALAAALLLVAVAVAAFPPALAGDVNDPDMSDGSGDATSGEAARDLVAGWVSNETETSISLGLKIAQLDPFTPYSDIANLPVVNYEFFFDITVDGLTTNWLARAVVPIHGPAAATASYALHEVTYNTAGQVTGTTEREAVVGSYNYQASEIGFVVDKIFIGDPGRDDVLSGIWGRITSASQRNAEDPVTEDTMASHLSPGRSFVFSGGVTYFLFTLQANETAANATAEAPVTFEVQIHSDEGSDEAAEVALRNSSELPANWTLRTDYQRYAVEPGQTATALVTITPDVNATKSTRKITVIGEWTDEGGDRKTTENAIQFTITIPDAGGGGPGPGDGGPGADPVGGLEPLLLPVGALGGAGAVGGLLFFVVLPRRRKRRARERFHKLSREQWAGSPRSGPVAPAPQRPPGLAGGALPGPVAGAGPYGLRRPPPPPPGR